MFRFLTLFLGLAFFSLAPYSWANQTESAEDTEDSESSELGAIDHFEGRFLGCVHSDDQCRRRAHHHGFRHHWAEYHHRHCNHHELACFARHH
jgi:hypothetical protein